LLSWNGFHSRGGPSLLAGFVWGPRPACLTALNDALCGAC
jgi:hypothetical protein